MPSPKTQPARGMRDFLPADVRKREYVIGVIKSVYERYGFEPLETPAVENIETLMGKYGEEGNQLIFKILKRGEHEKTGEADLALRYDLTVPLARVVAQYQNELPKFFKRYQIQPVWRADRPARGRFREFYQCDVDVLGSRSMVVEAELIAAASDALVALGFNDFTIHVNHRLYLEQLLNGYSIPQFKHNDALTAIDKLDKIGVDGVTSELLERGISPCASQSLIDFVKTISDYVATLRNLERTQPKEVADSYEKFNARFLADMKQTLGKGGYAAHGLDQLEEIVGLAKFAGVYRIRVDPTLARGLSYYTGAIMEISVEGIGSLGGGGRYDNLVGMFLGRDVPACGFSLGLERIIVVMSERGLFPRRIESGSADVMVAAWDEGSISESLKLASNIRSQGLRVLFYPEVRKPAKQLFYADKQKIRSVIIVGPNEIHGGNFRVKDKYKGEHTIPKEQIAATLRSWFDEREAEMKQRREGFETIVQGESLTDD